MSEAAQPTIPSGDTVWFDDTMPSGMSFQAIGFDTSQKASGTQSLHIGYGAGSFGQDTAGTNATQPRELKGEFSRDLLFVTESADRAAG